MTTSSHSVLHFTATYMASGVLVGNIYLQWCTLRLAWSSPLNSGCGVSAWSLCGCIERIAAAAAAVASPWQPYNPHSSSPCCTVRGSSFHTWRTEATDNSVLIDIKCFSGFMKASVVSGLLHAKAALPLEESAAPGIWEDMQKTEISVSTGNETLIPRSLKP